MVYAISQLIFLFLFVFGLCSVVYLVVSKFEQNKMGRIYLEDTVEIVADKMKVTEKDILGRCLITFTYGERTKTVKGLCSAANMNDKTLLMLPKDFDSAVPKSYILKLTTRTWKSVTFNSLCLLHFAVGLHYILQMLFLSNGVVGLSLLIAILVSVAEWSSDYYDRKLHKYTTSTPRDPLCWAYRVERFMMPCGHPFFVLRPREENVSDIESTASSDDGNYVTMEASDAIVNKYPELSRFSYELSFLRRVKA